MSAERWDRLVEIYQTARTLPVEERDRHLSKECGDDTALKDEILEMLAKSREMSQFLEPPPWTLEIDTDSLVGKTLGGYRILEKIGSGGMGVVYRAKKDGESRVFALKILTSAAALSEEAVRRFSVETGVLRQLNHPGIVHFIEEGADRQARFFVMEFVPGHNLEREIELLIRRAQGDDLARPHLGDPTSEEYIGKVVSLVVMAAEALAAVHAKRIWHRDIKPSNLLLDSRTGQMRIVDFGVARDMDVSRRTRSGDLLGSPHYMSPEQVRGEHGTLDHRADIFSLGVVLYELLTLKRAFSGETFPEVFRKIREVQPVSIRTINPKVSPDLQKICSIAIEKSAADRYASMSDFAEDLRRFHNHQAVVAAPARPARRVARFIRNNRINIFAAAGIALAITAAVFFTNQASLRRMRSTITDRIKGRLAHVPFDRLSPLDQAEVVKDLNELDRWPGDKDGDVAGWRAAVDRHVARLSEDYNKKIVVASNESTDINERILGAADAQSILTNCLLVAPDKARTLATQSPLGTVVTIACQDEKGAPVRGQVFSIEIDPSTCRTGEKKRFGDAPLLKLPLRPGYYRLRVEFEGGGSREYLVNSTIVPSHARYVATQLNDEKSIVANMVRFNGGDYVFPGYASLMGYAGKSTHINAFLLDKTEVSNAEYHKFMEATGHAQPKPWSFIKDIPAFLKEYGNRPVVGVSWYDAVAYAEWCGKRLPSAAEWLYAAGGREHRPYPYVSNEGQPPLGNVNAPSPRNKGLDAQGWWNYYLQYSHDVTGNPEARTPEGIYHMFGNVQEFTESMALSTSGPAGPPAAASAIAIALAGVGTPRK